MSIAVLGSAVVDLPMVYDHMPVDGETARVAKGYMMVCWSKANCLGMSRFGRQPRLFPMGAVSF